MVAELGVPDEPVALVEGAQVNEHAAGTINGTDKSRGLLVSDEWGDKEATHLSLSLM